MKKPAVISLVAITLSGAAAAWLHFGRRTTEESASHDVCRVCGSYRIRHTTAVDGVRTQASSEIRPSRACTDLLGDDHGHDWAFEFVNSEFRKGRSLTRSVHGDGFPGFTGPLANRFTTQYNRDEDFRALVQARIRAGELSRELAGRIVLLRDLDTASEATARANALLGEFSKVR